MAVIKPSQKGINRRIAQISELKAKVDKISLIEAGRDSAFWKALKEFLQDGMKKHSDNIENILEQDEAPADIAYAALKKSYGLKVGADAVISLVETTEDVRAQYVEQIKNLEAQIKDAQESGVIEPQEAQ